MSTFGHPIRRLVLLCLLLAGAPAGAQSPDPASALITPVNVVSVATGEILRDRAVLIEQGRITAVLQIEDIPKKALTVIDGQNGYLIPGLAEMHAHVPSRGRGEQYARDVMTLFLANGVTTIRGMLGEPWHLDLRRLLERQQWPGPRLLTSGPSFNGNSVSSPQQAVSRVREQEKSGYDFLKLHPGLTADEFTAIALTSATLNIPIAGHVSVDVGLDAALKARQATIDHLDGYAQEMVPRDSALYSEPPAFFGINLSSALEPSLAVSLAKKTAASGVWNVPTQSLLENIYGGSSIESLLARPGMKYLGTDLQQSWVRSVKGARNDVSTTDQQKFLQARRRLVYELQQAGAGLLLGSDAPQIMNVPGFSVHQELGFLVLAGLTPLQALQTGTRNPAQFFGQSDRGSIEQGQLADLVLLRGNPLADIQATSAILGVMRGGQWYSRDQLDVMLADVAERGL